MDKSLYVINSVYHLVTVVHLRLNAPAGEQADAVVTDATPGLLDLAPRLRETGLFHRVIPAATAELSTRYPMNRPETVAQCLESRDHVLRWVLREELEPAYRQVFYANPDWLARLLACRYPQPECPFWWFEDGFSSYVIDYFQPDRAAVNRHPLGLVLEGKTAGALLYQPELAMRGDRLPNLPLPKLSREDHPLRDTLNFLFQYRPPQRLPDFLFLEQSFRVENIVGNDLDLMRACREAVGPEHFGVKTHPRCVDHLPQELGLTGKVELPAPWELYLLNGDASPALVTVCSNGALSPRLCLGLDLDTVLLYKLYTGKVLWKENAQLSRFLEAYRRRFAGKHTFVPETIYQLRSTLKFLGGRHGV